MKGLAREEGRDGSRKGESRNDRDLENASNRPRRKRPNKVYNFSEKIQFNYHSAYIVMWCLEGGTTFGSYPRANCGPMADETVARLNCVSFGLPTPALSARCRAPGALPLAPQEAGG
jgi:hypothetical protein